MTISNENFIFSVICLFTCKISMMIIVIPLYEYRHIDISLYTFISKFSVRCRSSFFFFFALTRQQIFLLLWSDGSSIFGHTLFSHIISNTWIFAKSEFFFLLHILLFTFHLFIFLLGLRLFVFVSHILHHFVTDQSVRITTRSRWSLYIHIHTYIIILQGAYHYSRSDLIFGFAYEWMILYNTKRITVLPFNERK